MAATARKGNKRRYAALLEETGIAFMDLYQEYWYGFCGLWV